MRSTLAFSVLVSAESWKCSPPAVCDEPAVAFKRVQWEHPRAQWDDNGGFCGSFSFQTLMMTRGAWVSEDLVRKANIGAPCFGHGNGPNSTVCQSDDDNACISSAPGGCEVGPENYAETCLGLRLECDVWDYNHPKPQKDAYKAWMKKHLVAGNPLIWVPLMKGRGNVLYGLRSCPNNGGFGHHEPVLGIGSNRSLDDLTVYGDDWMMHLSDHVGSGLAPYYRSFSSLEDDFDMEGNCKRSDPMRAAEYPCFFAEVTYGVAVKRFLRDDETLRVTIDVKNNEEPDLRSGDRPCKMHAHVTVHGLIPGSHYILYRYDGFNSFPTKGTDGYASRVEFIPTSEEWQLWDPKAFSSDSAVYYIAVPDTNAEIVMM